MRENLKSGSVRGLIVTSEPILQQKVDYEPYLTGRIQIREDSSTLCSAFRISC
jgi:hypothetical protein